jgi:hypothetical protein
MEGTMANDRDNRDANPGASKDELREQIKSGKRVIGKGMTSPDSTQVPLRADTGEPDEDAIKGRVPPDQDKGGTKKPS